MPLWAGPPFETDDPEPTDYQNWEIYAGATATGVAGDFSGTGPFLELNYGGFPDVQLSAIFQNSFNLPSGMPASYGFGDILTGAKFRFLHANGPVPDGAFFPQVNLPTGDAAKGLGSGQYQFLLPLWFQESWGLWTSYGGAAYWTNPGPGNKNWVFAGWELQRDLSPALTLGGELFYHSADRIGGPDSVGFNLGGMANLDDVNHIVFSAGRDVIQSEFTFTSYAAWEWTFPMPIH